MADVIVEIFTPSGAKVGEFVNPTITVFSGHHYSISGKFCDAEGAFPDKIEFNPQVLPYTADISGTSQCPHTKLVNVYVQRGRQPMEMTGSCARETAASRG